MENSGERTSETSSHQGQSSEGVRHFICRGDHGMHQKLLGSNLTQQQKDRANIFWQPSGRLLEYSCQQVSQREDLWLMAQVVKLRDEQTIAC